MNHSETILIIPEGKVRDYVDGTIRNDTPEEYVRQTVEKRLVNEHKYAKERIAVEYPVQMGSGRKRADIVIFPDGVTEEQKKDQQNISIIIECKKEAVKPSDKDNGLEQLKTYMSACNNCEWGMWTNGLHKTVFKKNVDETAILFSFRTQVISMKPSFIKLEMKADTGLARLGIIRLMQLLSILVHLAFTYTIYIVFMECLYGQFAIRRNNL